MDGYAAQIDDVDGLREQVTRLQRRLDAWDSIARREVDYATARAVQSVGIAVDYLAAKGLLDKEELRAHVERHFAMVDANPTGEDRRGFIDLYGWLTWAEATRGLRRLGA